MSNDGVFEQVLSKARFRLADVEDEPTVVVETTQGDEDENPTEPDQEKSKLSAINVGNFFRNPDTHPLVLDLVLLKKYNITWMAWELETLQARIIEDFGTPTIADVNVEKLQACKTLHLVDDFWLRWEVFLPCCAALNGSFADFQRMQAPEVAECMVAVDIANRIRDDVQWSTEVRTFLSVVHRHDGVFVPQPPLDFVTLDLTGLPMDVDAVRARWPEVRAAMQPPRGDTVENEQLRRMLAAWSYLQVVRERLQLQLHVLQHV